MEGTLAGGRIRCTSTNVGKAPGKFTAKPHTSGVVEPPVGMDQVDRC
jgi:hypothetical protein